MITDKNGPWPHDPGLYATDWRLTDSGSAAIDRLFRREAFDFDGWEGDFVSAMREAFFFHMEHSPIFRSHVEMGGFDPSRLKTLADVEEIPWIFVRSFKLAEIMSVSSEDVAIVMTSSGTAGTKTKLFMDAVSANRFLVALFEVYKRLGTMEQGRFHKASYLMASYDIRQAPNLGTAWTDVVISEMFPGCRHHFLLRHDGKDFAFNLEESLNVYREMLESGEPIRFLGFPAFLYKLYMEAKARGFPRLSPAAAAESWVLTGGGWKNHAGESITKEAFAGFAQEACGLPKENVRDMFGMSEHGIGYLDCEHGRLHIPVYAHALTRDPMTLKRLPDGQPGILQLFTPLWRSYPSMSLLTTDEALVRPDPCACGRPGRGLEILGRLGLKPHEGCALRALDYLKGAGA